MILFYHGTVFVPALDGLKKIQYLFFILALEII